MFSDNGTLSRGDLATRTIKKSSVSHVKVDINRIKETFEWTVKIESFGKICESAGLGITSSAFTTGTENKDKWYLELFPGGRDEACKDYFSLYLMLCSSKKSQIPVRFEVSLCQFDTSEKKIRREAEKTFIKEMSSGWRNFVRRSEVLAEAKNYVKDNQLKILCKLDFDMKPKDKSPELPPTSSILGKDLWFCFKRSKFSDVTILAGDEKFYAHGMILAARSSVFCSMLEADSEKPVSGKLGNQLIKIEELEPDIVGMMLQFIYTDNVSIAETKIEGLLAAADKYNLSGLRILCEKSLTENLDVTNAADTLVIANRVNAKSLKQQVIQFMNINLVDIVETPGYKNLEEKHTGLLKDLLRGQAAEQKAKDH